MFIIQQNTPCVMCTQSLFHFIYTPRLLQNKNRLTFACYPGSWNSSKACPKKSSKNIFVPSLKTQLLCDASSMLQPHQCVLYEGGLSKDYWGFSSRSCLMPSTQAEALLSQQDVNSCVE